MSIYHLEDVWRKAVRLIVCVCLFLSFFPLTSAYAQDLSPEALDRAEATIQSARSQKAAIPLSMRSVSRVVLDKVANPLLPAGSRLALDVTLHEADAAEVISLVGAENVLQQTDGGVTLSVAPSQVSALAQINGIGRIAPTMPDFQGSNQMSIYDEVFVDTDPATSYSFPDDAHDFCKAEFDDAGAAQDYLLGAFISGPTDFELTWADEGDAMSDFDLYLLDENGYKVGDPAGLFPDGFNGTDYQGQAGSERIENAQVDYTGDEQFITIVIDRFRGAGNASLSVTATAADGTFRANEYQGVQAIYLVDAVTNMLVTEIQPGDIINPDTQLSTGESFNLVFQTDGCAQSAFFELTNTGTSTTESAISSDPFSLYGSTDGDYSGMTPVPGNYDLAVRPFAQADTMGNAGATVDLNFTISGEPPITPYIDHYTLINSFSDEVISQYDPIPQGTVFDWATLALLLTANNEEITIRANMNDPELDVESVKFYLYKLENSLQDTVLIHEIQETFRPYSLFGDARPDFPGDVPDGVTPGYFFWGKARTAIKNKVPANGEYLLEGIPFPTEDDQSEPLLGRNLRFSVTNSPVAASFEMLADNPLLTNFPNPFNPSTTIRFGLIEDQQVELTVFDLLGRQIEVLVDGVREAGFHEIPFDARHLASGVYLYRLKLENRHFTRRMVVMK